MGSNKIYISKRVSKIFLQTSIFKRRHITFLLQTNIVCLFIFDLDSKRSLKPLSLIERCLWYDFFLKKHRSLDNNQFFTSLIFSRTIRRSSSRIDISDSIFCIFSIFRIFLRIITDRFPFCNFLSGSLEIIMTIFPFRDNKTFP